MSSGKFEVAVIALNEYFGYEDSHTIIRSITDWTEVTREEWVALQAWVDTIKPIEGTFFQVIQKVPVDRMPSLISECLAEAKKFAEKQAKEKEERERKRKERALKREKEKLRDKKKLLEELKAELGET